MIRDEIDPSAPVEARPAKRRWAKRFGTAAFLFFLIKGLLWLLLPAILVAWGWIRG